MRRLSSRNNSYLELYREIRGADIRGILALIGALPGFFRNPFGASEAAENIERLLDLRQERFLELARTHVYEKRTSPYAKLLKLAGCDFSDLRAHVRAHGLEETLRRLSEQGVYLTADEFKGKKPVVRNGDSFRVTPKNFETTDCSPGYVTQSSGTTNPPLRTVTPLDWLAVRALATCVFFSEHQLLRCSHAVYEPILPGSAGCNLLLSCARFGLAFDRWFARRLSVTMPEAAYFRLVTYLFTVAGKCWGPGFPTFEFVETPRVDPIVHWITEQTRQHRECCITTAASNAARIARAGREMGVSLEGTKFVVSGEPFTEAKRKSIVQSGASATCRSSYGGSIITGHGCGRPLHTDEVHVNQHLLALIDHTRPLGQNGFSVRPLLCTTLHPAAPRFLFNVESGDYGVLSKRDCGCLLERAGLTLHLHGLRSFEKFTSEGMNYLGTDLLEHLEETFPAEFGGGPGDYQIVEEETDDGQTRLTLLVSPEAGNINEERLLSRLFEVLLDGAPGNRVMANLWRDSGTFQIRREKPYASPRGKILPLHIPR